MDRALRSRRPALGGDAIGDHDARASRAAHFSIATLPGTRERTIVLHSLSKSHALAGCRVGFALAPRAVVAAARRVSTHSGFNVAVAMQRVALSAIGDDAFARAARDVYREARDAAARLLVGNRELPAFTFTTHAPPPVVGEATAIRQAVAAAHTRPSQDEPPMQQVARAALRKKMTNPDR